MAYLPIADAQISLDTAAVSRAGFKTTMFIDDHMWFTERSRSYTSLVGAAADLPTDSNAYAGVVSAFSSSPQPAVVKVGRREADDFVFTPAAITSNGQIVSVTVVDTGGTSTTATFTSTTGGEADTAVVTALKAALGTPAGITIGASTTTLDLTKSGNANFSVSDVVGGTYAYVTTETAADMMAAITAEDDDFFFMGCSDHTDAFVIALATDVQAREKQYVVSSSDEDNLDSRSDTFTDLFNVLNNAARTKTAGLFHQDADTAFPEMAFITVASTADPAVLRKSWANNKINVGFSSDSGIALTPSQKGNLEAKQANYIENVGGINITRNGYTFGQRYLTMYDMRNKAYAEARLVENIQNYQIATPIVPHTDAGYAAIENVMSSTFDRMVSTETSVNILEQQVPYLIDITPRSEVSFGDISAGIFTASFTLHLTGEIRNISTTGSMTFRAA